MNQITLGFLRDSEKRFQFLTILVGITLPFPIQFNSVAIILLFINWLFLPEWIERLKQLKSNRFALVLIGFYLYHVLQVFNSSDVRQAFFDLEKKLAFFLLPLIFATTPFINEYFTRKVLFFFSWSCLLAALICLCNSIYYLALGDSSYLFYHKLGSPLDIHAVYFSLYISASIYIQWQYLVDNWKTLSIWIRAIVIIAISFLIGFLLLLSSKTIILSFFLTSTFLLLKMIFRLKGKLTGWITSFASVFALFFFLALIPNVKARFVDVLFDEYKQENPLFLNDYQGYHFTGGNIRLAIWKICIEAVNAENAWIIGVGPGDTQTILTKRYIEKNIYPGDEIHEGFLHYNAHNQFLQYYMSLGIIGLGFFIIILGFLVVTIFTKANITAGCISIVFLSFCFTESVMERQKGIVFFTFFSCLLVAKTSTKVVNIRTLG